MSFFLVRLLQVFSAVELAPELQPEGSLPPDSWKDGPGRQAYERICPKVALTLYIKVTVYLEGSCTGMSHQLLGWIMGALQESHRCVMDSSRRWRNLTNKPQCHDQCILSSNNRLGFSNHV